VCDPQEDEPVAFTLYVTLGGNDHTFTFYLWILDSATTSHITHTKSGFHDYTPIKPTPVKGLGNVQVHTYCMGMEPY
jgi:hypothetical protein